MKWHVGSFVFLVFSCVVLFNSVYGGKKYVSNLSAVCLKCLCYASTQCNATVGCQKGYCGLFFITKEYWQEAGRPTLVDDDPDRTNAFSDCSKDYNCASTAVEGYMAKNGFDCNTDGVTDCDDYARIHFHGKDKCLNSIANLNFGRRYDTCRPVTDRGSQLTNYYKKKSQVYVKYSRILLTTMEPVPVIPEFYAGKKILITGATGFLGKVLIWKLLYSCPRIDTIYVIIRAKWGKNDKQRLKELFDFPIFDNFKKDNPKILEKVVLIPGELLVKDFNLAESDKQKLLEEVSVVFHVAAILKMDATLKQAVEMNVEATMNLLNICVNMKNLNVFVYVSTTYCYCDRDKTDNTVYPAKYSPYDIMQTVRWMDDEMLKKLTPSIIKPHPNTYTYSKRLAENLVSDFHPRLPVVIARPSIIISSHKEPFPGYIDNLNGVVGIMMGVGKGVLRSLYSNPEYQANVICVDNVCNSLIGIAWQVAESEKKSSYLPVYNVTMSEDETPTWEDVMRTSMAVYFRYPFSLVLWYPSLTMNTNRIVHVISTVLFQWIPAYFIDLLILIAGFKPFMIRVQKKIALGSNLLSYFTIRQWEFDNSNIVELRNSMNESDRALFPVTAIVKTVEAREEYVANSAIFVRSFLGKDDPESIPRSIRNMKILYVLDRLLKIIFFAGILRLICKICFSV